MPIKQLDQQGGGDIGWREPNWRLIDRSTSSLLNVTQQSPKRLENTCAHICMLLPINQLDWRGGGYWVEGTFEFIRCYGMSTYIE